MMEMLLLAAVVFVTVMIDWPLHSKKPQLTAQRELTKGEREPDPSSSEYAEGDGFGGFTFECAHTCQNSFLVFWSKISRKSARRRESEPLTRHRNLRFCSRTHRGYASPRWFTQLHCLGVMEVHPQQQHRLPFETWGEMATCDVCVCNARAKGDSNWQFKRIRRERKEPQKCRHWQHTSSCVTSWPRAALSYISLEGKRTDIKRHAHA